MKVLTTLHERLTVKSVDRDGTPRTVEFLDNDSIRPTRVQDRTWSHITYIAFWFSASGNVSNLYAASTGLTVGLSMWESIICQLGGQILAGILMALNGRAGALYRISFPVLCRSSWGPLGALWPTFNRAVMAIVWNGVNAVQGAQCLNVLLHSIFPSMAKIPNTMGSKSALTSAGMICFFVFWLVNCAFLFIPIPKMRLLVYIKVVAYYSATVAMLAWTLSLSGSSNHTLRSHSTIHGTEKSWMVAKFFWLGLASVATFVSNAADLQRYARRPNDVILGQMFSFPVANFIIAIMGCVIAATSEPIFGELIWNPINILERLMEGDRYTAGNRAGCFFISLGFVYSTIFTNIFENSIPVGNDIAALLPKYLNVKLLSYAICPWYLLSSAAVFIKFLSSYQIFLSAIAGVLLCDYYLIRRGRLCIPELYTMNPEGRYHYLRGINFRAFAVYLVSIAPSFYGFLSQLGVKAPLSIQRFYYVSYPTGLLIAFIGYYLICLCFPIVGMVRTLGWYEPRDYIDVHDSARDDTTMDFDGVDVSRQESDAFDSVVAEGIKRDEDIKRTIA
ncbi:permease for cytosine/purines, uracil, thiamine, allantoin-domain-containing protein [Aspergillus caelatus]|uniref:Permease for cytosine/purines, uracil, thiamine, allantoin-domain-containing protein n=1 Tax=Aspergillus caelatus TaxID=61420 RepID=A0A5N6ZRW1_9EURO|nr:permease for cytosine/purines, uracil, thiamine, allantoin-domain-containing protein [Aspergillus caelatus]KAE8359686.1 permease for cytosine/purines, uracil, thiamine, allantoin-domain-containing protein [Aspergillus caelatus]